MTGRVVLILSDLEDLHVHAVLPHLRERGVEVHHINTASLGTADAPVTARLSGGRITGAIAGCDLERVGCVWHRRPGEIPADNPKDAAELRAGVGGILATLPHLNHPADMAAAALKVNQLKLAAECGLSVPDTVISTNPDEGMALEQRIGGVIVKPLSGRITELVQPDDRSGWRRPIHQTQQRIDKACDVRLTVVDDEMFAVEIHSKHLDYRNYEDCTYRVTEVPRDVVGPVLRMMAALRLRYGAWDFSVDRRDGTWWVLEVNPNGQWLWLQHEVGVPIASAIADALATDRHMMPIIADHGALIL